MNRKRYCWEKWLARHPKTEKLVNVIAVVIMVMFFLAAINQSMQIPIVEISNTTGEIAAVLDGNGTPLPEGRWEEVLKRGVYDRTWVK